MPHSGLIRVPKVRLPLTGGQRRMRLITIALAVVGVLLLGVAVTVLYVRGGGPLPSWAGFLRPADRAVLRPSSPAEVVLRTLRLAGYERAVIGEDDGTVVVRLEVPAMETTADVALSWQTAMAVCSEAYPKAERIVVQLYSPRQPLLEVSAPGDRVRAAVAADDARALAEASAFRHLSEVAGE